MMMTMMVVMVMAVILTMDMAGEECPPLSSFKEKSERVAVDQEGNDFYWW